MLYTYIMYQNEEYFRVNATKAKLFFDKGCTLYAKNLHSNLDNPFIDFFEIRKQDENDTFEKHVNELNYYNHDMIKEMGYFVYFVKIDDYDYNILTCWNMTSREGLSFYNDISFKDKKGSGVLYYLSESIDNDKKQSMLERYDNIDFYFSKSEYAPEQIINCVMIYSKCIK